MKKRLSVVFIVSSSSVLLLLILFVLKHNEPLQERNPMASVIGSEDDPEAAFRYRYGILAGNQTDIDVAKLRADAINYTETKMKRISSLSKTSSTQWAGIGPGNIGGRVRAIVVNPTDNNIVIIGTATGGIWKTTNGGETWEPKTDDQDPMSILTLLIDPQNSKILYAGTGEGDRGWGGGGGIYKSTNFGDSWTLLTATSGVNAPNFRSVITLAADGVGGIFATTVEFYERYGGGVYNGFNGGLYKSTDGGTSWNKISTVSINGYQYSSGFLIVNSTKYLYSVRGVGLYVTTNSGSTWTKVTSTLPTSGINRIEMSKDPNSANTIFAVFESTDITPDGDGGLKGIYKSTDGGINWNKLSSPPKIASTGNRSYLKDQGWYDNVIGIDPNNSNNIFVGGIDYMKTTNGGTSWAQLTEWDATPNFHADQHAIAFHAGTPNLVFAGNDGGVFKSLDGGKTWKSLNNGLAITQFYGGAVYRTGTVYHGGAQDNGHMYYNGTGTQWKMVVGGDGGYAAQDQTDGLTGYEEYTNLWMRKTTDGGKSFNDCIKGLTDANTANALFIAPFSINPENSSILVAGSDKVWITSDKAANWTKSSDVLSVGNNVSAVTVINASANYLGFAGTTNGKIFRCTGLDPISGIDTWTDITPAGNNGGWVRRIVVDLTNKNKVYATYGAYNATGTLTSRHVWYSTDQGTNWKDISGNLPNAPVHTLLIDPNSTSTLHVGTEIGVYISTNTGTSWAKDDGGMPSYAPTYELVAQKDSKSLFAFTFGRGVFTTGSTTLGTGWAVQQSGTTNILTSVKAVSNSIAWAAGLNGTVLVTTNSGFTWNSVGGGALGANNIYAIEAVSENTAFVSVVKTDSNFIYRTVDKGVTWNKVFPQYKGFINAIKITGGNNGIAMGDPVGPYYWTIAKTTNGGTSWYRVNNEPGKLGTETGYNNSMATFGTQIWCGTNIGKILYSTDGGNNWSFLSAPLTKIQSIEFTTATNGIIGDDSLLARTTDGGLTWKTITLSKGPGPVNGISGVGKDYFAKKGGIVYHSSDYGATWKESFAFSGTNGHLDVIATGSGLYCWVVSDKGNIAVYSGTPTGVKTGEQSVPSDFVLNQNYPNPFNPSTVISYQIPGNSPVSLKVYDALGREVATLVNEVKEAGRYSVLFDGSKLSSGTYIAKLNVGEKTQVKKLLLLK